MALFNDDGSFNVLFNDGVTPIPAVLKDQRFNDEGELQFLEVSGGALLKGFYAGFTADGVLLYLNRDRVFEDITAPTITSANPSGAYDENVPIDGTLTADESVTWSKSGADQAAVTLDSGTGVWSLEATDFETKTSYDWTFTATDPSLNASNQVVAITINDVVE